MATLGQKRIPKLASTAVLKREDLTPDLMLMWFEKPEGFGFKAGQYCTLGVDGGERAYSIVSAPHEGAIELFFELVPEGELTPKIWRLQVGDQATMRPRAKGLFTMDPGFPNQLLVATVTGIVPFVSYIRDYLHKGGTGHRFFVLQGASYQDEFAYDQELERIARDRSDLLTFVPTVSRPDEERNKGWKGETGRVNTLVDRYADRFGLSPEDTLVYACGHPGMIEDVKARMIPNGFQVKEERFWKEG